MSTRFKGKYSSNYEIKIDKYIGIDYSKICFIFPGQNSAYPEMFKELQQIPNINSYLKLADNLAEKNNLEKISNYIININLVKNKKLIKLLALFTIEVALAEYLIKIKKIMPLEITGHSFGEYAALVISGICKFEDIFKFIIYRENNGLNENEAGYLIAVFTSEETINKIKDKKLFEISNINSPKQIVIAVKKENLEKIEIEFEKLKLEYVILKDVNQPFHSSYMKSLENKLKKYLLEHEIKYNKPIIPFFSSVLGKRIDKENFIKYKTEIEKLLYLQVITKVDFIHQIKEIYNNKIYSFLEVGPKQTYSKFIDEILEKNKFKTLNLKNYLNYKLEIETHTSNSYFFNIIQKIISKTTGYEIDSIKIEDKFEEDLGIDSIKKADIIFEVLDEIKVESYEDLRLSQINSLNDLNKYLENIKNKNKNNELNKANKILISKNFTRFKDEWIEKKITEISKLNTTEKGHYYLFLEKIINNTQNEFKKIIKSYNKKTNQNLIIINEIPNNKINLSEITKLVIFFQEILQNIEFKNIILINFKLNVFNCFEALFKSIKTENQNIFFKTISFKSKPNKFKLIKILNLEIKEILDIDVLYNEIFIRYIKQLKEIKLNNLDSNNKINSNKKIQEFKLDSNSIILILGGAKGITFEGVKEISKRFKPKIHIIGTSPLEEIKKNIDELKKVNKNVYYKSLDATNYEELDNYCEQIILKKGEKKKGKREGERKINLIINGVGVHFDKKFENKDRNEIEKELFIKLMPVINSLKLQKKFNIDKSIHYSSIVSKFPSHGQSIYSLSNKIINLICQENQNSISISWPAWYELGMTQNKKVLQSLIENNSIFINKNCAYKLLIEEIENNNSNKQNYVYYLDQNLILKNKDKMLKNDSLKYANFNLNSNLIGDLRPSNGKLQFIKEFNIEIDEFLKEHKVGNLSYISASTMLGIFTLMNYYLNKKINPLQNFEILNPIIIKDKLTIHTILNNSNKLEIRNNNNKIYASCNNKTIDNKSLIEKKIKIGEKTQSYNLDKRLNNENLYVGERLRPVKYFFNDSYNQNIGIIKNIINKQFITNQFIDKFILIYESAFHTIGKKDEISLPIGVKEINFKENLILSKKIYVVGKITLETNELIYGDCYILNDRKEIIIELIGIKKHKIKNV